MEQQNKQNIVKSAREFIEGIYANRPKGMLAQWEFTNTFWPCSGIAGNVDAQFREEMEKHNGIPLERMRDVLGKIFGNQNRDGIMFALDKIIKGKRKYILKDDKCIIADNTTFFTVIVKEREEVYETGMEVPQEDTIDTANTDTTKLPDNVPTTTDAE